MGRDMSATRRNLLKSAAALTSVSIAGCSKLTDSSSKSTGNEQEVSQNNTEEQTFEIDDAKSSLNKSISKINRAPMTEDDEIAFRVNSFQELSYDALMDTAESVLQHLIEQRNRSNSKKVHYSKLISEARTVYLRTEARLLMNDIFVYGRKFEHDYTRGEYRTAYNNIEKGKDAVEYVPDNIEQIKEEVHELRTHKNTIQSTKRVNSELTTLKNIAKWGEPAYSGFSHAARGMQLIKSSEPPENKSKIAEPSHYKEIEDTFRKANMHLRLATDKGWVVPGLNEIFESIRCIAPDIEESASKANSIYSGEKIDNNSEERRAEAFIKIIQSTNRCL